MFSPLIDSSQILHIFLSTQLFVHSPSPSSSPFPSPYPLPSSSFLPRSCPLSVSVFISVSVSVCISLSHPSKTQSRKTKTNTRKWKKIQRQSDENQIKTNKQTWKEKKLSRIKQFQSKIKQNEMKLSPAHTVFPPPPLPAPWPVTTNIGAVLDHDCYTQWYSIGEIPPQHLRLLLPGLWITPHNLMVSSYCWRQYSLMSLKREKYLMSSWILFPPY